MQAKRFMVSDTWDALEGDQIGTGDIKSKDDARILRINGLETNSCKRNFGT